MDVKTILNIILIVLVSWFIISRFLPVKGVQNIQWKRIKNIWDKMVNNLLMCVQLSEYRGNHIKGFRNIPLNELANKRKSIR